MAGLAALDFIGTIDVESGGVRLLKGDAGSAGKLREMTISEVAALNPKVDAAAAAAEFDLVRGAVHRFDMNSFREGHLTPVFFGSALKNFGVRDLLDALAGMAPSPRSQKADKRVVTAEEPGMSAFVFKVQANMDPNHRDRIAFVRVCSGKLNRGMKVTHVRTGKVMSLRTPQWSSSPRIGRSAEEGLCGRCGRHPQSRQLAHRRHPDREGETLNFIGVPKLRARDLAPGPPARRHRRPRSWKQALQELGEEGVVQVFGPRPTARRRCLGVVGPLQLDVLRERLAGEYGVEMDWSVAEFSLARWITAEDRKDPRSVRVDLSGLHRGGSRRRRSGLPGARNAFVSITRASKAPASPSAT